jgi:hypothetical protein
MLLFFKPEPMPLNDFYYVVLSQKGKNLKTKFVSINSSSQVNKYMAFIGPVFIDTVESL